MKKRRPPRPGKAGREARTSENLHFFTNPAVHVLLVLVLGVIVYANTFDVPFVLDDLESIADNQRIRSLSDVPEMFVDVRGMAPRACDVRGQLCYRRP